MPGSTHGIVVYRVWGEQGMVEGEQAFSSLDELFSFCLSAETEDPPKRVHHVIIRGLDASGQQIDLRLAYQALIWPAG